MGSPDPESQPLDQRPVVAFDFDGTLTVSDSFTGFLVWNAGPWHGFTGAARLAPALLSYAVRPDRGRLKAKAAKAFLSGLTRPELALRAEAFARDRMPTLIRPDALRTWNAWGEKGVRRAIVSASPDEILAPFAHRLGADCLIATRLKWGPDGRLTGELDGLNCRGPEKTRRLVAQFGTGFALAAAYGDTAGDREMLAMAETPGYRVFTERPQRQGGQRDVSRPSG
ncbi:MAG TPA: HAD-IB family hydrolase [Caulobacteraceae bacterium]|nr:HAD-IB family hydrolase [Caulobacteraceae bacterium]